MKKRRVLIPSVFICLFYFEGALLPLFPPDGFPVVLGPFTGLVPDFDIFYPFI